MSIIMYLDNKISFLFNKNNFFGTLLIVSAYKFNTYKKKKKKLINSINYS
jgi:hypothetical protein